MCVTPKTFFFSCNSLQFRISRMKKQDFSLYKSLTEKGWARNSVSRSSYSTMQTRLYLFCQVYISTPCIVIGTPVKIASASIVLAFFITNRIGKKVGRKKINIESLLYLPKANLISYKNNIKSINGFCYLVVMRLP